MSRSGAAVRIGVEHPSFHLTFSGSRRPEAHRQVSEGVSDALPVPAPFPSLRRSAAPPGAAQREPSLLTERGRSMPVMPLRSRPQHVLRFVRTAAARPARLRQRPDRRAKARLEFCATPGVRGKGGAYSILQKESAPQASFGRAVLMDRAQCAPPRKSTFSLLSRARPCPLTSDGS